MDDKAHPLSSYLTWSDGLPHLQWDRLGEDLSRTLEGQSLDDACWGGLLEWLNQLATALGTPHHWAPSRSGEILLLSALPERQQDFVYRAAQRAIDFLRKQLGALEDEPFGIVLVAPRTREQYARYVRHYNQDPAHVASGGLFIGWPLPHIALSGDQELWAIESCTAHELSHCFVSHLGLPVWLDEGLASTVQRAVMKHGAPFDAERIQGIRSYFADVGPDAFWQGRAFDDLEGRAHAYGAAELIVGRILANHSKDFADFARDTPLDGIGVRAARRNLDVDLAELASGLLDGPVDGVPERTADDGRV